MIQFFYLRKQVLYKSKTWFLREKRIYFGFQTEAIISFVKNKYVFIIKY